MKVAPLVVGTVAGALLYATPTKASFLHNIQSTPPTKTAFNLNTAQNPSMRTAAKPLDIGDLEPEAIRSLWMSHIKNENARDHRPAISIALKHASPETQKRWAAVNALLGEKSMVSDIDFSEILDKDEVENINTRVQKAKEAPDNSGNIRIDDLI